MTTDLISQADLPAADSLEGRMAELEFFVGTWDAPGLFHETPFGSRKEIEMHVDGTVEGGGSWISVRTAEQPTADNPTPLTARYMWGYDPAADQFTADWYDSNGGRATQRSSGWNEDRLEFLGSISMNGNTVPLRDTFTRKGRDAYHHIGEIDLGEGWVPVDEEDAVRQGPQR